MPRKAKLVNVSDEATTYQEVVETILEEETAEADNVEPPPLPITETVADIVKPKRTRNKIQKEEPAKEELEEVEPKPKAKARVKAKAKPEPEPKEIRDEPAPKPKPRGKAKAKPEPEEIREEPAPKPKAKREPKPKAPIVKEVVPLSKVRLSRAAARVELYERLASSALP